MSCTKNLRDVPGHFSVDWLPLVGAGGGCCHAESGEKTDEASGARVIKRTFWSQDLVLQPALKTTGPTRSSNPVSPIDIAGNGDLQALSLAPDPLGRRHFHIRAGCTFELLGDTLTALGINSLRFLLVAGCLRRAELAGELLARLVEGHSLRARRDRQDEQSSSSGTGQRRAHGRSSNTKTLPVAIATGKQHPSAIAQERY